MFNFLIARATGGSFLLRIEDTDVARGHDKYVAALQEDLRWLGLDWQEGAGVGGERGPYLQSQRRSLYDNYFAALEGEHRAYPCFCTPQELDMERKAQLAAAHPPRYSGRCYRLSADDVAARFAAGMPATLRFHVDEGQVVEFDDRVRGPQRFATDDIGDFVIRRSSGAAAFFFSNAVDDALMEIRLVVRGDDHLSNTPRQILILQALGLPLPEYAHIGLVVASGGAPLSKREGGRTVQDLREAGFLPLAVTNYLARLGHTYFNDTLMDLTSLAAGFDLARVSHSPARFDHTHLLHWQREAVQAVAADALWHWLRDALDALVPTDKRQTFVNGVRANITLPADAREWAQVIFSDESFVLTDGARQVIAGAMPEYFDRALDAYEACVDELDSFGQMLQTKTGKKGAAAYRPVRLALTNRERGPELARLLELMPADRIRQRLRAAKLIAAESH